MSQETRKITDKDFIDWENHYFGYGYGTGEEYTLSAMRTFLTLCNEGSGGMYDYEVLEKELGASTAWLLINFFAHADLIEYGTSARHAWLNQKGKALKEYMLSKTLNELYDLTGVKYEDSHVCCTPKECYCDEKNTKPQACNPLFL